MPRRLLIFSSLLCGMAMLSALVAFALYLRLELRLAPEELTPESHRLLRLGTVSRFPTAFMMVWTLRLGAMLLAGLHLAAWARALGRERPFLGQSAAYFVGLGVTLESLAWTFNLFGSPSLASWYWETVPSDQAIPFRLFGILTRVHSLLSLGLAGAFLCGAGLLLSLASISSKAAPRRIGLLGLPLFGGGLAGSLFSPWVGPPGLWWGATLLTLFAAAFALSASWAWFRFQAPEAAGS